MDSTAANNTKREQNRRDASTWVHPLLNCHLYPTKVYPYRRTLAHQLAGHWKATGQNVGNRFNCNQFASKLVNMEILACWSRIWGLKPWNPSPGGQKMEIKILKSIRPVTFQWPVFSVQNVDHHNDRPVRWGAVRSVGGGSLMAIERVYCPGLGRATCRNNRKLPTNYKKTTKHAKRRSRANTR